jgi:NADH dehydrogenase
MTADPAPVTKPAPHRVVIIGGGFGGLFAARALRRAPVEVIVVDRVGHHLFQPLLYQCATGILSEGQIAVPLRHVLRRYRNVGVGLAEVVDIDVENRRVIGRRIGGAAASVPYDTLIVAAGMQQSYFGHDEYAQWAPGMKTTSGAGCSALSRRHQARPIPLSSNVGSPSPWLAPGRPG